MVTSWRRVTLGDLERESQGVIQTGPFGSQLHASDYSTFGTPVVMPTNIRGLRIDPNGIARVASHHVDLLARHVLRSGDIVYSRRGDVEKCALVTEHEAGWLCGTGCLLVRVQGETADARFLSYALSLPETRAWISQHAVGATMPNLNTSILREVGVQLPPIKEQQRVGATLVALDDKIDSNRRAMSLAMETARSHVDRAIAGHSMVSYGQALQVRMGSAFKGVQFSVPSVGRPLLRIRDLKTFESQTWTNEERSDEVVIRPGDVVVGMDAEFRATLWLGLESVMNQRVCSFVGQRGVGRAFVLAALEPQLAFQEAAKTGTTVIHLNKADIDTFEVPDLTSEEHKELSELTEPLIDLVVARSKEVRSLAAMRDALLPELLAGRIRVPEETDSVHRTAS